MLNSCNTFKILYFSMNYWLSLLYLASSFIKFYPFYPGIIIIIIIIIIHTASSYLWLWQMGVFGWAFSTAPAFVSGVQTPSLFPFYLP